MKKMFALEETGIDLLGLLLNAGSSDCTSILLPVDKASEKEASDKGNDAGTDGGLEDYQKMGVKLLTLAKSLIPKHKSYTPLGEKIAKIEFSSEKIESLELKDLLSGISKIIRRELRGIGTADKVSSSDIANKLYELTPHIEWSIGTYEEYFSHDESKLAKGVIRPVDKNGAPDIGLLGDLYINGLSCNNVCRRNKFDPDERTLYLYCPMLFQNNILCGLQLSTSGFKNATLLSISTVKVVDLAYAIAFIIIMNDAIEALMSKSIRDTIGYRDILTCCCSSFMANESALWHRNIPEILNYIKSCPDVLPNTMHYLNGNMPIIVTHIDGEDKEVIKPFLDLLEKKGHEVWLLPCYEKFDFSSPLWKKLSSYLPFNYQESFYYKYCKRASDEKKHSNRFNGLAFIEHYRRLLSTLPLVNPMLWIKAKVLPALILLHYSDSCLDEGDAKHLIKSIADAYHQMSTTALPAFNMPCYSADGISLCMQLFLLSHKISQREVRLIAEEKEFGISHAKSFETKANIPQQILRLMKDSSLNTRFGYVEYDETCDPESIDTVDAQILNFVENFFPEQDLKTVSVRFRRLGNHKAYGLYYPAYRCICVEISHPNSFVHEFGHMLDYLNGSISNRLVNQSFSELYERYVHLFDQALSDNPYLKKKYQAGGKASKYNYYLRETEVFARSFEMYVSACINFSNTILRSKEEYMENELIYPYDDDIYMELLFKFFDGLDIMYYLKSQREKNENVSVA